MLTDKGKELLFYIEEAYNSILVAQRSLTEEENLEKKGTTIQSVKTYERSLLPREEEK